MARTRRRAYARNRINLEIVGIAAVALAVFCGVALAFPHHAGAVGSWTAAELRRLFGGTAPLFPVLVALLGAIVFLEVNVPRMIAGLGSTALAYFLIVRRDVRCGRRPARRRRRCRRSGGRCTRSSAIVGAWIVLCRRAAFAHALADAMPA